MESNHQVTLDELLPPSEKSETLIQIWESIHKSVVIIGQMVKQPGV